MYLALLLMQDAAPSRFRPPKLSVDYSSHRARHLGPIQRDMFVTYA